MSNQEISSSNRSWQEVLGQKLFAYKDQPFSINQIAACHVHGDGVGNCMLHVRNVIREWGIPSYIFTHHSDGKSFDQRYAYEEHRKIAHANNLLFLHPSDGTSPIIEYFKKAPDKKYLYYHNITPAKYFAPYNEKTANICETAATSVSGFLPYIKGAICDSHFNAQGLEELGFNQNTVIPLPFFRESFENQMPDADTLNQYSDGKHNILFVGRLAPNKAQHDLINCFSFYKNIINPNSRLILAGHSEGIEEYTKYLHNLVSEKGLILDSDVVITGHISIAKLLAFYKASQVFLCLSEHEGFCLPLLESMNLGLPVIAYPTSAIGETLGNSGVRINARDPVTVSQAIESLRRDPLLVETVINKQFLRVQDFSLGLIREKLAKFICDQI